MKTDIDLYLWHEVREEGWQKKLNINRPTLSFRTWEVESSGGKDSLFDIDKDDARKFAILIIEFEGQPLLEEIAEKMGLKVVEDE